MLSTRIATTTVLALAFTACSAAGNAPLSTQAGASAQSAGFVPQSADAPAAAVGAFPGKAPAFPQPPPEPLIALGRGPAPGITSPIIDDRASYLAGPIVLAINTATNGYGMEGLNYGTGAGLYGHDNSTGTIAYGVLGSSAGGAGVYGYDSQQGSGVLGVSVRGNGVFGETSYPSSGAGAFQKAGVLGEDVSNDGGYQDAGVAGISTNGNALYGSSTNGDGAYGFSSGGNGVYGVTQSGYAVDAEATGTGSGIYSDATGSGEAIIAQSGGISLLTENGSNKPTMSLDASGNMILLGNLTVDGTVSAGSSTKPLISSPGRGDQIESVGDAQLANGSAVVQIDPAFAKQLDSTKSYHVFLTPDGDSKGLYVTGKTSTGFGVRENQGGRSTLSFDYRIVGTPRAAALPSPVRVQLPARPAIRSLQAVQR